MIYYKKQKDRQEQTNTIKGDFQAMKQEIIDRFRADLEQFNEATRRYYAGELDRASYKGISGGFGSYSERDGKRGMLRLRMTGGRMDKDKLSFVVDAAHTYGIDTMKLTTCETIQLHHLTAEQIMELSAAALDHGIYCRGGGGDHPRNVTAPPLSGVQPGETFDVMPYVQAAGDYLLSILHDIKMPRKLKVGFANHPDNLAHATIRDLGFVARADGAFDVYSAGGMGPNARLGLKMAEAVPGSELLYYIRAMVDTFLAHGNYELRAKARTRYMPDAMGEDAYRAAFAGNLAARKAEGGLDLTVTEQPVTKTGKGEIAGKRVIAQKQPGLFAVSYHPLGGTPSRETLTALRDTIRDMDAVEIRLGADGTMYVINCTADEARRVLDVTADGAETRFEHSVACIGALICQQGARDSQGLYHACVDVVRKAGIPDGALPQIHISGCPSSCGTHQVGVLGFHGGVKIVDKKPLPAFTLHVGGSAELGHEHFAENWGPMLEERIPQFLVEVGQTVAAAEQTFEQWLPAHRNDLRAIAKPYLD